MRAAIEARLLLGLCALVLASCPKGVARAAAESGNWVVLDRLTVKIAEADQDVVTVGRERGTYTHIEIKVARNAVRFFNVKVIYGNRDEDHLRVHRTIAAGGSTGPLALDLRTYRQRVVREIVLTYQSQSWLKGRAEVTVLGKR